MKAYEFDWQPFFDRLRTWNEISVASRSAYLLTDTIVELRNPKDQAALVKKLRAAGIFIQPRGKEVKADIPGPG